MSYIVRQMQDGDIPQAIEIDREAFPSQWPRPTYSTFKQELRNRLAYYIVVASSQENEPCESNTLKGGLWQRLRRLGQASYFDRLHREVAPTANYIVGIAGFWVMLDEAHITTIAVRKDRRRQGIGERLLIAIIDMAVQMNAKVVTLEVRVSNVPAQMLYEKYGFQKVGVRRGYYSDNGEDALLMTTDPINSGVFQGRFQQLKRDHLLKWGDIFANEITALPKRVSSDR